MGDYYNVLGIDYTEDINLIKKAYRSLMIKHHPDTKQGDVTCDIKEINEAFDTLSDPSKKSKYDRGKNFNKKSPLDFEIKDFFNRVQIDIRITIPEAYYGITKTVRLTEFKECFCKNRFNCKLCKNTNKVKDFDFDVDVTIPKGVTDNSYLKIRTGDLVSYIGRIIIDKDEKLELAGKDLLGSMDLTYTLLVLGGKIEYTLFKELFTITIPPKWDLNRRLLVKGKGMPYPNSNRKGNFYLKFNLKMPKKVNKKHLEILESLREFDNE